ncbi:MAG: hypothetical protein WCJ55_20475, partial [Chloroflexales bacterium]
QNTSGKVTEWRTHIGTYIAGFQASQDWVRPNIGMGVDELRELGGVPMNKFPGPGYFTVRSGVDVATVRAPWVDIAARQAALALLPDTALPLSIDAGPEDAPGGKRKPELAITPEEEARILAAAALHSKRTDVCAAAFAGAMMRRRRATASREIASGGTRSARRWGNSTRSAAVVASAVSWAMMSSR